MSGVTGLYLSRTDVLVWRAAIWIHSTMVYTMEPGIPELFRLRCEWIKPWLSISHVNNRWEVRQIEINNEIFVLLHVWRAAVCGSGWNLLAGRIFCIGRWSPQGFQPWQVYQGKGKQWVKEPWFKRTSSLILHLETKAQKGEWTCFRSCGEWQQSCWSWSVWFLDHTYSPCTFFKALLFSKFESAFVAGISTCSL